MTQPQPSATPFPIGTKARYESLLKDLANGPQDYESVTGGRPGVILRRLSPGYSRDKFWWWYLGSRDYESYHEKAWTDLLPVEARLRAEVKCLALPTPQCEVKPLPRVLLFPFGWSTWLSLLVCGDHDLASLSAFVQSLFSDEVFEISGSVNPVRLDPLLSQMAKGVWQDAFGDLPMKAASKPQVLVVTTVLEKRQDAQSWQGWSVEEREAARRIVRPSGPTTGATFTSQVREVGSDDAMHNFVFMDRFGRFVWLQRLLQPEGRNAAHLRCYHNNTFRSLVFAWHQIGLAREVINCGGKPSGEVRSLIDSALHKLRAPDYRNAGLLAFLQESDIANQEAAKTLDEAEKLLGAGGTKSATTT